MQRKRQNDNSSDDNKGVEEKATAGISSRGNPDPPAMGERRARWGYGYQDKLATAQVLDLLRADIRDGTSELLGIRLADLQAGRVDDFVLVLASEIRGNSIKWNESEDPVNWGDLVGVNGLMRELADGWRRLSDEWPEKHITVYLQTNRPASGHKHPAQIINSHSVSEFFQNYWHVQRKSTDSKALNSAWQIIEDHAGLRGEMLQAFVKACTIRFAVPQPPASTGNSRDAVVYREQFDALHKAIATWLTNHPQQDLIPTSYLLSAINLNPSRSGLIQRFPDPYVPYVRNSDSAKNLRQLIDSASGGYLAVTGSAGAGKSTLVQDVLSDSPFFIPYYAYLPDGIGNPRDRGQAIVFFQDVVTRLDKFFEGRASVGISDVAQGREALRTHMAQASELYRSTGVKTVLLIDGLDHVQREPNLERSLLLELPRPEEVPEGFLIILSSQPQTLLPDAIERHVAATLVPESGRRMTVSPLTREQVLEITAKQDETFSYADRTALFESCGGNPLILTYVLKLLSTSTNISVPEAIAQLGTYSGDLDTYYRSSFSIPLRNPASRQVLGLLSRAAPNLTVSWLLTWPERYVFEELYDSVLQPFIRTEGSRLLFIHNSLVTFLKNETRSRLPGADATEDERAYHKDLAEKCGVHAFSSPLGRARVFHLARAGEFSSLVSLLSSEWLREALVQFVPYAELRPVLLEGLGAAWKLSDYGTVVRLILLDHELSQRTGRLDGHDLALKFLRLEKPRHAIAQVRSGGRLLIADKHALRVAAAMKKFAAEHSDSEVGDFARTTYLQSKPLYLLYRSEPMDRVRDHEASATLRAWLEAAPWFEQPEAVCMQLNRVRVAEPRGDWEPGEHIVRAVLFREAISAYLDAGGTVADCYPFLVTLARMRVRRVYAAALLNAYRYEPSPRLLRVIQRHHRYLEPDPDLDLLYAETLAQAGQLQAASALCARVQHLKIGAYGNLHTLRISDIWFTIRLQQLQATLGLSAGGIPDVPNRDAESAARVERVARDLGELFAGVNANQRRPDLHDTFRQILLFHNRPVAFPNITPNSHYTLRSARPIVYGALMDLSLCFGLDGRQALWRAFEEVASGLSASQFSTGDRQRFALFFFRTGTITAQAALTLGFSGEDPLSDDPTERQEACLESAVFARQLGDSASAEHWLCRAAEVSAGSGNHKDYHMIEIAEWLTASCDVPLGPKEFRVLDKCLRALEVAGGRGAENAAKTLLTFIMRLAPGRATALAIELVDRGALDVPESMRSLLHGGGEASASASLLLSCFCRFLTLLQTSAGSETALAIMHAFPAATRVRVAKLIMESVRTNSIPSRRVIVARALEDQLIEQGAHVDLGAGLPAGHEDSSNRSSLYRMPTGSVLTRAEVSLRLRNLNDRSSWNPNPSENGDFDWWSAIKQAEIEELAHAEELLSAFPPPDYKQVEVLAWKSEIVVRAGDIGLAKRLAEQALGLARKASWSRWFDGAQKMVAYGALKRLDEEGSVNAARRAFGDDLSEGQIFQQSLLGDLPGIFDFLNIPWPKESALDCVEDYLGTVLNAAPSAHSVAALFGNPKNSTHDEAIVEFLVHLLDMPVAGVRLAARQALSEIASEEPAALKRTLMNRTTWTSTQLEHLLICFHLASLTTAIDDPAFAKYIQGMNQNESIAVRAVARRICEANGWIWGEVHTNQDASPLVVIPSQKVPSSYQESGTQLGDLSESVADLFEWTFSILGRYGSGAEELKSQFRRYFLEALVNCVWIDEARLRRWVDAVDARFWLKPEALIGREAALRTMGVKALAGLAPSGTESSYDYLYPVYDETLDLLSPVEIPNEMRTLNWDISSDARQHWLKGRNAEWENYPHWIGEYFVLGERSLFIRPEWEWPREERFRSLLGVPSGEMADVKSSANLTYSMMLDGLGQEKGQRLVANDDSLYEAPNSKWITICPVYAKRLGWRPSGRPFEWLDTTGEVAVKSVFWRNGWVGHKPPLFETLGEGCLVLATPRAVKAILAEVPAVYCHLWVQRHSHGDHPYQQSWHLARPLTNLSGLQVPVTRT